ncbi:hypothetical protein [Sphingomonas sp.]|uniref:hypothetical protein n=1 Tax=Sphingomonas sp. TaxID=28214 RepID=UPI003AFF7197
MSRLERTDGVARVVIDRAAKRNAVGLHDWNRLREVLAAVGLVELVDAVVAQTAVNAPTSLVPVKAGLCGETGGDARFDDAFASADTAEGLAALAARRDPAFAR